MPVVSDFANRLIPDQLKSIQIASQHVFVHQSTFFGFERAIAALAGDDVIPMLGFESLAYKSFSEHYLKLAVQQRELAVQRAFGRKAVNGTYMGGMIGVNGGILVGARVNMGAGMGLMTGGFVSFGAMGSMLLRNHGVKKAAERAEIDLDLASEFDEKANAATARVVDASDSEQRAAAGNYLLACQSVAAAGLSNVSWLQQLPRDSFVRHASIEIFDEYAALSLFQARMNATSGSHPFKKIVSDRLEVVREILAFSFITKAPGLEVPPTSLDVPGVGLLGH